MTDQIFEPGDKVMRVAHKEMGANTFASPPEAWYGKILCVERCFVKLDGTHGCTFVGIQIPPRISWSTYCFRKVEEIKFCVEAIRKVPRPLEEVPSHDPTGR